MKDGAHLVEMDNMKVSFIILNWNTCEWLIKLINSLREYEPEIDYELIIVDQGSTDESYEFIQTLIRQHPKPVIPIYNHQNVGACNGRNQGVDIATGNFILFCDSDIEFCELGWLEAMIDVYHSNPDCGIVGPYTNYANGHQRKRRDGNYPMKRLHSRYQLISFCMLTPIEIARAVEWNPVLKMFTEADWVRRVIAEGWMSYIAPTYVTHHGHKSITSNKVNFLNTMNRSRVIFDDMWKSRNPHLNWCESVVIWLDSGLGNCVMALPFLQALRTYSPHIKIDVYSPRGEELLKLYPYLYDNLGYNTDGYDICFRLCATSQPRIVSKWTLSVNVDKWLQSEIEENMNLLRVAGYNGGTPRIQLPQIDSTYDCYSGNKTIVFHTGSYYDSAKEWPFENFLSVAEYFALQGFNVGILGGKEETHKIKRFVNALSDYGVNVLNSVGQSIEKTLIRLKRADLLITNDSGVMHLASIVGTPILAIFGYTNRIKNPPCRNGRIIQSNRNCVPCYGHGPCERLDCLKDITVDMVISEAGSILSKKS